MVEIGASLSGVGEGGSYFLLVAYRRAFFCRASTGTAWLFFREAGGVFEIFFPVGVLVCFTFELRLYFYQ